MEDGGHPKQFMPVLKSMPIAQGERQGEILGFWGKKMMPQLFKWDDASKADLLLGIDETAVLNRAAGFIAEELGVANVDVVLGESDADTTERSGSAMPLSPAVVYV
jgi:hypothetical protein